MKKITDEEYAELVRGSKIVEQDKYGPKVFLLEDGNYLKLFRVKRVLSWANFYPYSKRFAKNADKLLKKNVPSVIVLEILSIPHIKRTGVLYLPLKGITLRSRQITFNPALTNQLGAFIASLHNKGIYFRSLHLGNIILTNADKLGLIDIADMKVLKKPLSPNLVIRNLKHLCRYQKDMQTISEYLCDFVEGYESSALKNNSSVNNDTTQKIIRLFS